MGRSKRRRAAALNKELPLMAAGLSSEHARIAEIVAMQLLADAMERFDTTILEIRHLQVNLIYAIRLAELHRALRHEESYVFGSAEVRAKTTGEASERRSIGWSELFEDETRAPGPGSIHLLGDVFVPRMPKPLDETIFSDLDPYSGDPTQVDGIEGAPDTFAHLFDYDRFEREVHAPMQQAVRQRLLCGQYDDQFRMNYDLLLALQALKRNVVIDKLHLYWWGWRSLVVGGLPRDMSLRDKRLGPIKPPNPAMRRAQFYMARAGALDNLRTYVERLADYHAQFEKTLDLGLQDNHRPITGRRREQGLYHFVLSEQTRELYDDASILMTKMTRPRDVRAGGSKSQPAVQGIGRGSAVVIHRWQHKFTSSNLGLLDISRSRRVDKRPQEYGPSPSYSVHAVNTSFWTPDRQDFRPTIMHECAHCLLKESYADLGDLGLLRKNDPLSSLVRMMKTAVRSVDSMDRDIPGTENLVREVLADLIALSVSGPSYLFGVFQELFGVGIEQTLGWPAWGEVRDLSLARTTIPNGFGDQKITAEWYVRLMTLANFIEHVERREISPLTWLLVEGVRTACRELLGYLDVQIRVYQPTWAEEIRELERRLSIVVRLSPLGSVVRAYRIERRQPLPGQPSLALSSSVRARLVEALVDLKRQRGRALFRDEKNSNLIRLQDEAKAQVALTTPWTHFPGADSKKSQEHEAKIKTAAENNNDATKNTNIGTSEKAKIHAEQKAAVDAARKKTIEASAQEELGDDLQNLCALSIGRSSSIRKVFRKPSWFATKDEPRQVFQRAAGQLPIFETLDDVPWQTSLMRSMELTWTQIGVSSEQKFGCLAERLGTDFAPGRTMHQVALEFWTYDRKRPHDRLAEAVRLVRELIGEPTTVRFDYPERNTTPLPLVRAILKDLGIAASGDEGPAIETNLLEWVGQGIEPTQVQAVILSEISEAVADALSVESGDPQARREQERIGEVITEELRTETAEAVRFITLLAETADAIHRHNLRNKINKVLKRTQSDKEIRAAAAKLQVGTSSAITLLKLHTSYPYRPDDYRLDYVFDAIRDFDSRGTSNELSMTNKLTLLNKLEDFSFWHKVMGFEDVESETAQENREANIKKMALYTLTKKLKFHAGELKGTLIKGFDPQGLSLIETAADAPRSRRFWSDDRPSRAGEEPPHFQATIAALAIRKIEELSQLLDSPLEEGCSPRVLSDHPTLQPLKSLCRLQAHAANENRSDPSVELALNSLSRPDTPRRIQPLLVSRTSFINSQFWRERIGNNNPTGERFVPSRGELGTRHFAVLGRYDYISLSVDDPMFVHRLPLFDTHPEGRELTDPQNPFSSLKNEQTFREFFERRDQALMFRLSEDPIQPVNEKMVMSVSDKPVDGAERQDVDADVLAFMSLRIDRRSSRIEVLDRLRRSREWWRQAEHLELEAFFKKLNVLDVERDLKRTDSSAVSPRDNPFLRPAFRNQIFKELEESLQGAEKRYPNGTIGQLVEQVREESCALPKLPLEAAGGFFRQGDLAMLGEGWPDIVLTFATALRSYSDPRDTEPARRLFDIFVLQQSLFQDFAIYRTEMFLRPHALIGAIRDRGRFAFTQVIRCREDRQLNGSMTRLIETINKELDNAVKNTGSEQWYQLYQVPGRNDLEMIISDIQALEMFWERNPSAASVLDSLHSLAGARNEFGGGAFEEIITRVSFKARR